MESHDMMWWALLISPGTIVSLSVAYVFVVRFAGPAYMKDKQAYSLKTFIQWYNIYQVITNFMLVYMSIFALNEVMFTYSWRRCEDFDVCQQIGKKYVYILRWALLSRVLDFIETGMFVLRKKQNQVSNLHVYHHISTVLYIWFLIIYATHCYAYFLISVNGAIHMIMYTYYYLSACGPEMQRIILPLKRWLTTIQMIQIAGVLVLLGTWCFLFNCNDMEKTYGLVSMINGCINLSFFWKFYKKSYTKAKTAE